MCKLNFDGKLFYNKIEGETPEKVLQDIADELKKETNGYIIGVVKPYEGPVESYDRLSPTASISMALGMDVTHKDIQEDLGKIGFKDFKYEFYITTPTLEEYKYRILFLKHGIGCYPIKIVLEQGIVDELFGEDAEYVLEKNTEEELRNVVNNVLLTNKVIGVMQDLINAANSSNPLKRINNSKEQQ